MQQCKNWAICELDSLIVMVDPPPFCYRYLFRAFKMQRSRRLFAPSLTFNRNESTLSQDRMPLQRTTRVRKLKTFQHRLRETKTKYSQIYSNKFRP